MEFTSTEIEIIKYSILQRQLESESIMEEFINNERDQNAKCNIRSVCQELIDSGSILAKIAAK